MNAERLLQHYEQIADASDAIARLRQFILDLAVRGKLVPQGAFEDVSEFYRRADDPAAPFEVPENWRWITIGEQLELLNGMAFKPTDWVTDGLRIVRIQNLNKRDAPFNFCRPETARERSLIDDGTFLISWSGTPGTSFGAFIWDRGPAVLNQHIFRCNFKTDQYQSEFLRLAINGRLDEMIAKAHGGVGLQHITKAKLEGLFIPLPPLAEQHRIVAKVDELMALCDELEAARKEREMKRDRLAAASLARLNTPDPETLRDDARFALDALPALTARPDQIKQLRQTILNLAVRGKLVPQDPADEPAAELLKRISKQIAERAKKGIIPKPKATNRDVARLSNDLSVGWSPIALGDVCDLVTSGSRGWGEYYADSGPGFVRAQNIRFGRMRLDDLAYVQPPPNSEGSRTQVYRNDLLIVITGAGVTNPALLEEELGEAYVSQHVGLVRPSDASLSRWLLLCLMADAGGRGELLECAYGAGKPGLNLDNIRSLSIPLAPLEEQKRIVAKVGELMALCDQLEANLTSAAEARKKLLDVLLAEALAPVDAASLREAAE